MAMARYKVFIRRTAAFLLGALLTSAFINDNGVQAAGTGLVNEQGEEIRLESRVNDSILWHVPLENIEDVYYHGTMLHDEQGNSYILADGSLVSIDLEGRRRWSFDVPRHGIAPRGLVRGEDGTIYVLEVEEFKDDRYTDRTGWITAVDPFDGKIRWQRGMPEGHRLSSNFVTAANSSGIIVVAASTGSVLSLSGTWRREASMLSNRRITNCFASWGCLMIPPEANTASTAAGCSKRLAPDKICGSISRILLTLMQLTCKRMRPVICHSRIMEEAGIGPILMETRSAS